MDGVTLQCQPDISPIIINISIINILPFAEVLMFESSNHIFETMATRPDKPAEGVGNFSKDNVMMTREVKHEAR